MSSTYANTIQKRKTKYRNNCETSFSTLKAIVENVQQQEQQQQWQQEQKQNERLHPCEKLDSSASSNGDVGGISNSNNKKYSNDQRTLSNGKAAPTTMTSSCFIGHSTNRNIAAADSYEEEKLLRKSEARELSETHSDSQSYCGSRRSQTPSSINSQSTLPELRNTNFFEKNENFTINVQFDLISLILFVGAFFTRFYRLSTPNNIVFDELHYGRYISLYMRNIFFFDQHPPLGKQIIAAVASIAGYNGNCTFSRIGAEYPEHVPIFWLRFVPALCGSLLAPTVYKLLLEIGLNRWTALLGGTLIIFDNSLVTQSRFILMESMLLLFSTIGILFLLRFYKFRFATPLWLLCGLTSSSFLTFAFSVKYVGFFSCCLAFYLMCRHLWRLIYDATLSNSQLIIQSILRVLIFSVVPMAIYLGIFYIHLNTLDKAGPHDSVMTSAFQASLEGGLASITKGQPLKVVHGSQITLRNTYGRACWLHSHPHVYPIRYPDKRGSSHQQQITCYSFKDVNNWWIVKRPDRDDLVVGHDLDPIKDGDVIQLVHGITSRGLNSHDVAAPVSPHCQEVSCYIDYEISMKPELLWRVEIVNKDTEGAEWHAIKSEIRLIHETSNSALRFTGQQLPEWGFNQHEIVADRTISNKGTIWNVEEHRYTKTDDQQERERDMLLAEMIPTQKTKLSFWEKFFELQTKMIWQPVQVQTHMYSSEPLEWPLLDKGIAYWIEGNSNRQIHLLGNILIWYSGTIAIALYIGLLIFYLIRRRRLFYDLPPTEWQRFIDVGDICLMGYFIHYLPYFFTDSTLFLHNYLPALLFKLMLLCYVIEHVDYLLSRFVGTLCWCIWFYRFAVIVWIVCICYIFKIFIPLTYGLEKLTVDDVFDLRWKETWDLILQSNYILH